MTRKQKLALVATIIGSGVVILDGVVVNLALPSIARDFGASFAGLQWIIDGYLLSLSALILLGGSFGDIFGRKRTYMTGLVGFGLTSLFCGLAPNINVLVGMRVIQGVFGALLVPGALAIINTNMPAKLRGKAIGQWTAWISLAPAAGPFIGGYLVDTASWRWIFLINVPLILVCAALGITSIKESRDAQARQVDIPGALLAITGLGATTYGLIEGPAKHWGSTTIATLVVGLLACVLFIVVEARVKDPMVQLKLFASRNFSGANISTFAMYGALSGFIFAIIIYLQNSLHYSSLAAGASLLPIPIMLLLFSGRVGTLAGRFGPRFFMATGPIVTGLGMLTLLRLSSGNHYLTHILPGIFVFSLGMILTVAPLTITVMGAVDPASSGIASGINNAVSRAAGLIVIAVLGIFGAANSYRFTIILCGGMAIVAGFLALLLIQNKPIPS